MISEKFGGEKLKPKIELLKEAFGELLERLKKEEYSVELDKETNDITLSAPGKIIYSCDFEKVLTVVNFYGLYWFIDFGQQHVIIYC